MKTETLILLAVGAYLLYRYSQNQHTAAGVQPPGMQIPPAATPPYVAPPRQILTAAQLAELNQAAANTQAQNIVQQTATPTTGGGNLAGIGYLCDTSNKLTAWGTNANYNAVTLKY